MILILDDFKEMISVISDKMFDKKEYLSELDSKMGDGDLGLSISKGFEAALKSINNYTDDDIGKALIKSGLAMNDAASSTIGTLISSGMVKSGKKFKGTKEVDLEGLIIIARTTIDDIIDKGKAKKGDKTLLDALIPAVDAFEDSIKTGKSLNDAFNISVNAAEKGVKLTKDMVAKHGRARYYGEASKNIQDAGATMVLFAVQALRDYFKLKT